LGKWDFGRGHYATRPTEIFPRGPAGPFSRNLGEFPLVTHARWIDTDRARTAGNIRWFREPNVSTAGSTGEIAWRVSARSGAAAMSRFGIRLGNGGRRPFGPILGTTKALYRTHGPVIAAKRRAQHCKYSWAMRPFLQETRYSNLTTIRAMRGTAQPQTTGRVLLRFAIWAGGARWGHGPWSGRVHSGARTDKPVWVFALVGRA